MYEHRVFLLNRCYDLTQVTKTIACSNGDLIIHTVAHNDGLMFDNHTVKEPSFKFMIMDVYWLTFYKNMQTSYQMNMNIKLLFDLSSWLSAGSIMFRIPYILIYVK